VLVSAFSKIKAVKRRAVTLAPCMASRLSQFDFIYKRYANKRGCLSCAVFALKIVLENFMQAESVAKIPWQTGNCFELH